MSAAQIMQTQQEREELFRKIYKIADKLVHAGHVSEWDFKSYVLTMMFYRYISESLTAWINGNERTAKAGASDFDYANLSDQEAERARARLINGKGYFIYPSELFENVHKRAEHDENLNETIEKVFTHIERSAQEGESINDFAGLFDDFDVNNRAIGETVDARNKVLR